MNFRPFVSSLFVIACTCASAADAPKLPAIPTEPIAKKKELLFSDDFERAELGKDKGWAIVVPTYALENGTLKGMQMRFDTPAKDGKPAVKGHQAVIGNNIPTKDSVVECRIKFDGATMIATVHPAYLLRLTDESQKRTEWHAFLADLAQARALVEATADNWRARQDSNLRPLA